MSCILFNIVFEKIIRTASIINNGTILNKSTQVLEYTDDIDIIGRSVIKVKEAFLKMEGAAKNLGLMVNERKTKLLVVSAFYSIQVKYNIHKTLIRPVLTYGSEC